MPNMGLKWQHWLYIFYQIYGIIWYVVLRYISIYGFASFILWCHFLRRSLITWMDQRPHFFHQSNDYHHYNHVIMNTMASQITSLTIVYSTVYLCKDQRKYQSFASLAFVWGPVNSSHKRPVTREMSPVDDVIMIMVNNTNLYPIAHDKSMCWTLTRGYSMTKSLHEESFFLQSNTREHDG